MQNIRNGETGRSDAHTTPFRLRKQDSYNWAIERRTEMGNWKTDGYYPTLEIASRRLLDKMLLEGEPDTPRFSAVAEI
ncbi:MAG: hypothetical protein WD423_03705 [Rhodothermales bacterium]